MQDSVTVPCNRHVEARRENLQLTAGCSLVCVFTAADRFVSRNEDIGEDGANRIVAALVGSSAWTKLADRKEDSSDSGQPWAGMVGWTAKDSKQRIHKNAFPDRFGNFWPCTVPEKSTAAALWVSVLNDGTVTIIALFREGEDSHEASSLEEVCKWFKKAAEKLKELLGENTLTEVIENAGFGPKQSWYRKTSSVIPQDRLHAIFSAQTENMTSFDKHVFHLSQPGGKTCNQPDCSVLPGPNPKDFIEQACAGLAGRRLAKSLQQAQDRADKLQRYLPKLENQIRDGSYSRADACKLEEFSASVALLKQSLPSIRKGLLPSLIFRDERSASLYTAEIETRRLSVQADYLLDSIQDLYAAAGELKSVLRGQKNDAFAAKASILSLAFVVPSLLYAFLQVFLTESLARFQDLLFPVSLALLTVSLVAAIGLPGWAFITWLIQGRKKHQPKRLQRSGSTRSGTKDSQISDSR